jgi:hypothetical protein
MYSHLYFNKELAIGLNDYIFLNYSQINVLQTKVVLLNGNTLS